MWSFLTNTGNSAALQAVGSILTVFITALSLIVTIILTVTSVGISKRQKEISEDIFNKDEKESKELSKKVSALIQYKLNDIEKALDTILRNSKNIEPYTEMVLDLDIDKEMILKSFETKLYHHIYSTWNDLYKFQEHFLSSHNGITVLPYIHLMTPEELVSIASTTRESVQLLKIELAKIYDISVSVK